MGNKGPYLEVEIIENMVETLLRTSDRGQRWRGFSHFIFALIL